MNATIRTVGLAIVLALTACGGDGKKMAADIDAWGVTWQRERACVLGDDPPAKDAREAFMVRAIVAGGARSLVAECLQTGALLRDDDARVDDQSVEATWQDLNKAVESLHKARADVMGGNEDAAPSLARRIAAVDSIYERLRSRAKMPPAVSPGTPLPEEPRGVVIGRSNDGASIANLVRRGNNVTVWQRDDGAESIAAVRGPTDIDRHAMTDVFPAADDDAWGIRIVPGPTWIELQLLDGTVIAREPAKRTIRIDPLFATGGSRGRTVVYEVRGALHVVKGVEQWPPPVVKAVSFTSGAWKPVLTAAGTPPGRYELDPYTYADWPARRADILWGDTERNLYWASIQDGALTEPARKSIGVVSHYFDFDPVGCFGARHAWVLSDRTLWFAAGDDSAPTEVGGYVHANADIQCNDTTLVRMWTPMDGAPLWQRCARDGCTAPRAHENPGALGLARDGTAVTAFVAHGVMFLQPDGERPRPLWRMGLHSTLYGILEAADGWHAIVTDPEGARLVPLGKTP